MILELLLGQYIFPISNQFYKKQYLPNVGFEYQVNIEIVYWPNIWSINFATWDRTQQQTGCTKQSVPGWERTYNALVSTPLSQRITTLYSQALFLVCSL